MLEAWCREWLRPKPPCAAWAERILAHNLNAEELTIMLFKCSPEELGAWARWLADQPGISYPEPNSEHAEAFPDTLGPMLNPEP